MAGTLNKKNEMTLSTQTVKQNEDSLSKQVNSQMIINSSLNKLPNKYESTEVNAQNLKTMIVQLP